ncbi:MAG: S8 family serine peptidase [Deltaproteobacteria bacterium]|nr:S8 family serine peptidase [Deltaproteobacteria bacterium]
MASRLLVLAPLLLVAGVARGQTPEMAPGEIIVGWRAGKAPAVLDATQLLGKMSPAYRVRQLDAAHELIRLVDPSPDATLAAVEALGRHPDVAFAQPNYIRRPFLRPNDPHYALQWHLKAVGMEQAWERSRGAVSVVVAVVDTGIRRDHPDLAGRLLPGYDFIANATSAADGDGWDDDPNDAGDNAATSSAFHGTHVAGIIGALSDNGIGVAGVNWACKILPVRALGVNEGKGTDADIAAAIRWAAGLSVSGAPANPTPAKVINLSFGGPGASQILSEAIGAAHRAGAIVVAAAGNQGIDGANIYPAAVPEVITVGATDYASKRAGYSNYGKVVDLVAPGGDLGSKLPIQYQNKDWPAGILSTIYYKSSNTFDYHFYEGTSQAAPLVAGVVSLMLTVNPSLTRQQTLSILQNSANGAGRCNEGCGAGLLNAAGAVQQAIDPNNPGSAVDLEFGVQCKVDGQCKNKICRAVATGAKICTQFCSTQEGCPNGSSCVSGLCTPPYKPPSGTAGTGTAGPAGAVIGTCALPPTTDASGAEPWAAPILGWLLLALRGRSRRKRRPA